MSSDSRKDLIGVMDQLRLRMDSGRSKVPGIRSKLIYVEKGAQREANHIGGSRLIKYYPQAKKAVAHRCRSGEPVAKEHRAIVSSYAPGFAHATSPNLIQ
jgi:hypothetical protein